MSKFTEGQLEVLEQGARGLSFQYQYKWALPNGRPVGREVAALKKRGLIEITVYRTGPGLSFTEAGRKVRAELGFTI